MDFEIACGGPSLQEMRHLVTGRKEEVRSEVIIGVEGRFWRFHVVSTLRGHRIALAESNDRNNRRNISLALRAAREHLDRRSESWKSDLEEAQARCLYLRSVAVGQLCLS